MIAALKVFWRFATAKPVLLAAGILAGLLLTGEVADWIRDGVAAPKIVYRPAPGELARAAAKWRHQVEPADVAFPVIPPDELAALAARHNRPDVAGGARTAARPAWVGTSDDVESPASAEPGAQPTPSGGFVAGSVARGARVLGEWTFTSPDEECSIDVGAFLEADGTVTTSGLWTNTPEDDRRPLVSMTDPRSLVGVPLRWRLTAMATLWPERDLSAALAFRLLRVHRVEIAPAAIVGYDFAASDTRYGLGAVATFDF